MAPGEIDVTDGDGRGQCVDHRPVGAPIVVGVRLPDPLAGTAGDLTACGLRLAHGLCDLGERDDEHVGQQEHGPLHRLEPVEFGEESQPERVGQVPASSGPASETSSSGSQGPT